MRHLLMCLSILLATGCFNTASVKLTPDQVIWTPRTEWGRAARDHLMTDFRQVVDEIQTSPNIGYRVNMRPEGLMIRFDAQDTLYRFISLDLDYLVTFNTLRTSYPQRAASAYSAALFGVASVLAAHPALFQEPGISAFSVILKWKATDFAQDRYRVMSGNEGMEAVIPEEVLKDFAA